MASSSYSPSAPPMPDSGACVNTSLYDNNNNYHRPPPQSEGSFHSGHGPSSSFSSSSNYGYGYGQQQHHRPGIDPDVIRAFQMVDKDRSGFVDDRELQEALSFGYQRFHLRTVRLLMFLFADRRHGSSLRLEFDDFIALWTCLGQWRGIFERFDRDRSGKIDIAELKEALYSLGYAVPPSVINLLTTLNDGSGTSQRAELSFDSFVERGLVIKGLTDKFKEKDERYTGSATLRYDEFMLMVLPYIVTYE